MTMEEIELAVVVLQYHRSRECSRIRADSEPVDTSWSDGIYEGLRGETELERTSPPPKGQIIYALASHEP